MDVVSLHIAAGNTRGRKGGSSRQEFELTKRHRHQQDDRFTQMASRTEVSESARRFGGPDEWSGDKKKDATAGGMAS